MEGSIMTLSSVFVNVLVPFNCQAVGSSTISSSPSPAAASLPPYSTQKILSLKRVQGIVALPSLRWASEIKCTRTLFLLNRYFLKEIC
ncbi:hypothetical protein ACIXJT_03305 [Bacteroides fragilis]|uniref:hypothetical protein n=1 Tax=Bacteroides fragilis TaxID=817 RepID=UPI002458A157|nr:hypothetical protein [Bacteroides fragilis]MCS2773913.1 hypothetical protein [Bacteroides fragilis]